MRQNPPTTDVSVIIPIYNTENFLLHCFHSVIKALGTLRYEVLLMDDGSTDGSGKIASDFAELHEDFFYHKLPHGGLSRTRNAGVRVSSGKYIKFLDSDDFLVPGIIEEMFLAAETSGADLAQCSGMIYENGKYTFNTNLLRCFSKVAIEQHVTTLDKCPYLAYDSLVTTKLIRRDFYLKNGIRFPEGVTMEDMFPVIQMLHLANSIVLLRTRGNVNRIRSDKSNTIRRLEYGLFKDKINALESVFRYSEKAGLSPQTRLVLEHKVICSDFVYYLNNLSAFQDNSGKLIEELGQFIRTFISSNTIDHLPLIYRQIVKDILKNDIPHLQKVIGYKNTEYNNTQIIKTDAGYCFASYPADLIPIQEHNVADDFYYSVPVSYIREICTAGSSLVLSGHLYHPRIDLPAETSEGIEAFLLNEVTGHYIRLPLERTRTEYLTKAKYSSDADANYCYDEAGFRIRLDLENQNIINEMGGRNLIVLRYRTPVSSGWRVLRGLSKDVRSFIKNWGCIADDTMVTLHEELDSALAVHIDSNIDPDTRKLFLDLKDKNQRLLEENASLQKSREDCVQKYQKALLENLQQKEQLEKLSARLKTTEQELDRQLHSLNWRTGDIITRIPKKNLLLLPKKIRRSGSKHL